MKIYPLKLKPVLKDIIWGGTALSDKFTLGGKGKHIAEAWTLALRCDGENIIENGVAKGISLREYAEKVGMEKLCGEKFAGKDVYDFPLLVKLIDAKDNLSVQAHQNDEYSHSHDIDSDKTAMWYIVDSEPDARLVYGLKDETDISSPEFQAAISAGDISEYLNYVNVKPGDVYYIPAGLVHAIGAGILIAEVQQNSNSTIKIYDYGRRGADVKLRELYLECAKKIIKTDFSHDHSIGSQLPSETVGMPVLLVDSEFFKVKLLNTESGEKYSFTGGKLMHIMCVCGRAYLESNSGESIQLTAAHSALVPAACTGVVIYSENNASVIISES